MTGDSGSVRDVVIEELRALCEEMRQEPDAARRGALVDMALRLLGHLQVERAVDREQRRMRARRLA